MNKIIQNDNYQLRGEQVITTNFKSLLKNDSSHPELKK